MGLIIFGVASLLVGTTLSIISYIVGNSVEYTLRIALGIGTNWAVPLFLIGIVLCILGLILIIVGAIVHNSTKSKTTQATEAPPAGPLFCVKCSAQLLSDNYVCGLCHHDNALDLFLRSADPDARAADINVLWYQFGLEKRFPKETKELLSLVQQEYRSGQKDQDALQRFLAKLPHS